MYAGLPGLRSKAFVLDEGSGEFGGNYIWETRTALDAFLNSELFQGVVSKFGNAEDTRARGHRGRGARRGGHGDVGGAQTGIWHAHEQYFRACR